MLLASPRGMSSVATDHPVAVGNLVGAHPAAVACWGDRSGHMSDHSWYQWPSGAGYRDVGLGWDSCFASWHLMYGAD